MKHVGHETRLQPEVSVLQSSVYQTTLLCMKEEEKKGEGEASLEISIKYVYSANETNPLDYEKQPASNQGAPLLKSKPPYPKQFSKDIALQQQLSQKIPQLLPTTKVILIN